ncbi:MAG: bifunctional folylpolyglutamate synthase/dihydrofolate synthase [Anaerolineaceae bacterium]|nr:MAG: bifunctional folylpolyglutamate synthase/dihydrofolate synthase [Anaerolineaceae bacterium]
MTEQRYQEALDYLYSHIDYSVERSYRYSPEVLDLERVHALVRALGEPQRNYDSVHIAGTKGKGSVSAMVASIMQAAGYKIGLYTSPHLQRFTERIRVDGQEISQAEVIELIEILKPHIETIQQLTVYEIITALAFIYFARKEVDIAVFEVGLGGRLDATNVITPMVSVITSLSYDHMHLLGGSLSDIAREKAGIIKHGVPVVSAPQQHEAELVVEDVARSLEAPLSLVGRDWLYSPGTRDLHGQTLHVWSSAEQPLMDAYVESSGGEEWAPPRYWIPLLGHHQIVNGAVAYATIQILKGQGLKMNEDAIQVGFRETDWPGRFQILATDPVLVVDAAHNRDSALKLRIALDDYFPGRPVTMIFGASADKDIPGMLIELVPRISRLIVTQADHPRASDPEDLARIAHSHGLKVEIVLPVEAALDRALEKMWNEGVVLATGSLFIAGEILSAWEKRERSIPLDAKKA